MQNKSEVLANAPAALNRDDQPWEVTVDGDTIIAKWRWMDARFFGPTTVTDETKDFTFTARLDDKGKWHEKDSSAESKVSFNPMSGKISFGKSAFSGKQVGKSFEIGLGKNKQTGETGVVTASFDTETVKKPIREYLKSCGYKKAGFFG